MGTTVYRNAKVFTAILEKTGTWPTTEAFARALTEFGSVDLGIGDPVTFGPGDRQALDRGDTAGLLVGRTAKPVFRKKI